MMSLNFRVLFPVILALLFALVGFGVYNYLKPMSDGTAKRADVILSSSSLLESFNVDGVKSDSLFKDKIIQINGVLNKININDSIHILVLDEGGAVIIVASCAAVSNSVASTLKSGDSIQFKGLYKGFIEGDELFGTPAEIKIDQCVILN